MYKVNDPLHGNLFANFIANTPANNDLAIQAWGDNLNNISEHHISYLQNIMAPNSFGPIEKHPYIDQFSEDFDLGRERLILGTFPPSSYFNNLYPILGAANPNIQIPAGLYYYYGNVNSFWNFMFGLNPINDIQASQLLSQNSFSISDVFQYIQRSKMNKTDDSFLKNIIPNYKINKIFQKESKIEKIIFTSGALNDLLNNDTNATNGFKWIVQQYSIANPTINISISGNNIIYYPFNDIGINNSIQDQALSSYLQWWIKIEEKKFQIVNLPSPSGAANRHMPRSFAFQKWFNNHIAIANDNGFAIPPLNGQNIVNFYAANFAIFNLYNPNIFTGPVGITNFYRKELYGMVLNNQYALLP
jgi:hypothetical protein